MGKTKIDFLHIVFVLRERELQGFIIKVVMKLLIDKKLTGKMGLFVPLLN